MKVLCDLNTAVFIICSKECTKSEKEILHQLYKQLRDLDIQAYMFYKGYGDVKEKEDKYYQKYDVIEAYEFDVIKTGENVLIITEKDIGELQNSIEMKIAVVWDNTLKMTYNMKKEEGIFKKLLHFSKHIVRNKIRSFLKFAWNKLKEFAKFVDKIFFNGHVGNIVKAFKDALKKKHDELFPRKRGTEDVKLDDLVQKPYMHNVTNIVLYDYTHCLFNENQILHNKLNCYSSMSELKSDSFRNKINNHVAVYYNNDKFKDNRDYIVNNLKGINCSKISDNDSIQDSFKALDQSIVFIEFCDETVLGFWEQKAILHGCIPIIISQSSFCNFIDVIRDEYQFTVQTNLDEVLIEINNILSLTDNQRIMKFKEDFQECFKFIKKSEDEFKENVSKIFINVDQFQNGDDVCVRK